MKLTKAQQETLRQVAEATDKGQSFYAASFYKPILKLEELDLVVPAKPTDRFCNHWKLTDKGRELLKEQS